METRPALEQLPHYTAPTLVVLDHDRTRSPTEAAIGHLLDVVGRESYGISPRNILEAQEACESQERPYDPLTYVQDTLDKRDGTGLLFERFREEFIATAPASFNYADTAPFEAGLKAFPPVPQLVLTAAANWDWQSIKLAASRYDGYAHIVPVDSDYKTPPKGPIIASWQDAAGEFQLVAVDRRGIAIATITARTALLIDDKVVSFESLAEGIHGICVDRTSQGERRTRSQGDIKNLPLGIRVVSKLVEIDVPHSYSPPITSLAAHQPAQYIPRQLYLAQAA